MKKTFVGYYLPSESEFADLWANGQIVVDANVLLAVYGVSRSTRETLLRLFDVVRNRLWIPHHFALEYHRNRIGKILEQIKHYDDAYKSLKTTLDDQFRSRNQHPFVSVQVERRLERICRDLLDGKAEQEKLLASDPYLETISGLFDGRVGAPYTSPELAQAHETASKRFTDKIPPGFKDAKKPSPERYGDYVGWRQILDFATKKNVSVILVTDDEKEDWWRKDGSRMIGPHPELVAEFRSCCAGLFYMYRSDQFLDLSGKYIGGPVDPDAIKELKERRESKSPDKPKAIEVLVDESLATKATSYSLDESRASTMPDTPKTAAEEIEKPEGA